MSSTPLNEMQPFHRLVFLAMCGFAMLIATAFVLSRPRHQMTPLVTPVAEAAEAIEQPQSRYDRERDVERVRIGERPTQYVRPTDAERRSALGPLTEMPAQWHPHFNLNGFLQLPDPQPDEWLAQHPERHQSFDAYAQMRPNRPSANQQVIYLLPLDQFDDPFMPRLADLREFTEAYFMLPTVLLPQADLPNRGITSRINRQTERSQLLTRDILRWMEDRLPSDAYCMIAVTMTDLYPDAKWNYVFGQATLTRRVGVYSFARFDPRFFGEQRDSEAQHRMLWRSCRLLAHETGHMFGLLHCVYFLCGMNGTNNQRETDGQPLALCPICLKKLQYCVGFDPNLRHQQLTQVTRRLRITGDEHTRYGDLTHRSMLQQSDFPATGVDE